MSPLDLNKPVQTRAGLPARIICTDRKSDNYPVIGLITDLDGRERYETYTMQGTYHAYATSPSPEDLVNVLERKSQFINVYHDNHHLPRRTLEHAIASRAFNGNTVEFIFEGHNLVEVIHHG